MYEQFFKFTQKPFNLTPDPDFYFPSEKHAEALDSLIYAIEERKGFAVITGEVGSGKTTVCRKLLHHLEDHVHFAMITNTFVTAKQMLEMILDEFEIPHKSGSKLKLLNALNEYLIDQLAHSQNVVLIIDEAQNLTTQCLEEIRMLSNLETEKDKLIQIILLGQPELRQKLSKPEMRQLRQRITVYYNLTPLTFDETKDYIAHRIQKAFEGEEHKAIFSIQAIEYIHALSKGVPRIINNLCDHALLSIYAQETDQVTRETIDEIKRDVLIQDALLHDESDDLLTSFESKKLGFGSV